MTGDPRVTDYDRVADRFDTRYHLHSYDGVRDTLLNFLGFQKSSVLEVGSGTGHWLAVSEARLKPSPDEARIEPPREDESAGSRKASPKGGFLAGIEPSAPMLERARIAAPEARLVRARAESLPWRNASFDRIFCVNALHHFSDRVRFFAEARRVLTPGGGLLTIGLDPHTERDDWWVYDYFETTRAIDRDRFPRVRTLRGEMALAGFAWTESMEAEHIEVVQSASEALASGIVDPSFTSQLAVLSEEEFQRGLDRLRRANDEANGKLQLVADVRLYATTGWV
jgi:ubiquinone/menaquinone biosynthesis C-methylase UbiE